MVGPRPLVLASVAAATLALGACGGGDDERASTPSTAPALSTVATPPVAGTSTAGRTTTEPDDATAGSDPTESGDPTAPDGRQSETPSSPDFTRLTQATQASTRRIERLKRKVQSITARVRSHELDQAEGARQVSAIARQVRREIQRMSKMVEEAGAGSASAPNRP